MDDLAWVDTNPIRKQLPLALMSMQRLPTKSPPGIGSSGGNGGDNREASLSGASRVSFDPVDQLPLRRSRADTMPATSFPYGPNDLYTNLAVPVQQSSRHRSGSMTLPADRPDLSFYSQEYSPFDSPTATDDSVSNTVASTLASLGLDDENTHQAPLTETVSRNRAYTVAGRAPAVLDQPDFASLGPVPFSPFSPQTRSSVLQRPRAISLGMADGGTTVEPPPPSLGQYELGGSSMQHFLQPSRLQQSAIPIIPASEQQRTLRGSRSSGNLLDLNQEAFAHRPVGRMGSHNQLGRLPEMTATKEFYTTFPIPSASSSSSVAVDSPPSAPAQIPSRALWLGNINPSLNVPDLMQLFSDYGHVESARILSDKECAFVNFSNVESAVAAKNDLETRLGNMLAGTPVRVGFGKADVNIAMALTNEAGPNAQGPTRALWVGNIPANMNPAILRSIFQPFGPIESVRVLSHKNCGFVNFEHQEDAVRARKSLQNKEILGPGTGTVRIGFAKVPTNSVDEGDDANNGSQQAMPTPDTYQATQWATAMMMSKMLLQTPDNQNEQPDLQTAIDTERRFIMQQLGVNVPENFQDSSHFDYSSNIRPLPESDPETRLEVQRLRDIKKRLENGPITAELAEDVAAECSHVIVDLCSDYIGNTIVQRIFENCSHETKQVLLEKISPYLPSIGIHKNGTWAAQKIIDHSTLPAHVKMIRENIEPYIPMLLLDQFGNYVVQCCLHMGTDKNQFVFDAIVDKCWEIGQGRFGSRAVRAILESPCTTREQKAYVAASIVQNAVLLSTQSNGAILLNWLLDSTELPGRYRVLCPRLLPYLAKLCAHKLGSSAVLKIIQQTEDTSTREMILAAIFNDSNVLEDVLKEQVHGVAFLQKVLEMSDLPKRDSIEQQLKDALARRIQFQNVQNYKKLIDQLGASDLEESILRSSGSSAPSSADNGNRTSKTQEDNSWAQNPQAVAMMANMYAAAMTAAATATQTQPKTSNIDIAQFDQLLKALLQQQNSGQQESDQPQTEDAAASSKGNDN